MPDYIGNWIKMLMGAKQVDPSGQMPPQDTQATPSAGAPTMGTNPMTGTPRAANYGQDMALGVMGGPFEAAVAQYKSMGYPEAVAVKLAMQQQNQSASMGAGASGLASKVRKE